MRDERRVVADLLQSRPRGQHAPLAPGGVRTRTPEVRGQVAARDAAFGEQVKTLETRVSSGTEAADALRKQAQQAEEPAQERVPEQED